MVTEPSPSRRTFLLGSAAAAAALPRLAAPPGDADDMAALGRLADVTLTAADTQLAAKRLGELREGYRAVRANPLPFELPPCTAFDPWPCGSQRPAPTPRIAFAIAKDAPMPESDADLAFADIPTLASLLRQGKVTSVRLCELALARLNAHDPTLHCVVNLLGDTARARAAELDRELAAGKDRGILHGIPYGAKDLFGWPGTKTTFGAAPFADQVWDVRATALAHLDAAGAVLTAKLSLGALAMGDLWHGGRTRNPWNPEQGSSGSSAGPAAAVAAGLVPFALGTETLGSIVSPCTRCGVAGLRPTFGSVSRYGAMPLSWTMDKIGPIARSALDAAIVFDCIRGADGKDPSARDTAFAFRSGRGLQGLRIGVLDDRGFPQRDVDKAFLAWLESQGMALAKVRLPDAPYRGMLAMLDAEAAAAFDEFLRQGLCPQLPGQDAGDWPNQFRASRTIPAVEYVQAARARSRLIAEFARAIADVDLFVAPAGGASLVATNLTGHPTYVLPVGASERANGRPEVLALIGRLDGEADLLATAESWQQNTDWHRRRPPLAR